MKRFSLFFVLAAMIGVACGARTDLGTPQCIEGATRGCRSACGEGTEECVRGEWRNCTAKKPLDPPETITISGTVRDFSSSHPDFEHAIGDDRGFVGATLGADNTPVFVATGPTATVSSKASFDQWFHDVSGVNMKGPITLELKRKSLDPLLYTFDDSAYFPIDGTLLGNEGRVHDFHFTIEFHTEIQYGGGETLLFRGDDDIFVFVNKKLALDLGGVHTAESGTIALDSLGLERTKGYPLDIFFCERHTVQSSLRLETNVRFVKCP